MNLKKTFTFFVVWAFFLQPLGQLHAQTPKQILLQKMEFKAALQRLELNKKNMTLGKLWEKVRPYASPESQAFMDRHVGLHPSQKLPPLEIIDISKADQLAYRIQSFDGKNLISMELYDSGDDVTAKMGRSVFTSEELASPEVWIKKYAQENRADVFNQQLQFLKSSKKSVVLSTKELMRLTGEERAMYFLNLRYLLASAHEIQLLELEKKNRKEQSSNITPIENPYDFFSWMRLLLSSANASAPASCVVAGWRSSFLPEGQNQNGVTCPFPASEGRKNCSNDQAPCNPAIFGLAERGGNKHHCIPFNYSSPTRASQRATLACHQKSHLDGTPGKTVALLKSMQDGNPNWFANDQPKPEHLQQALQLAETINAETRLAFDLCRLNRRGELQAPSNFVQADRFNERDSYDGELNADTTEAKQKLACEVLASRQTALQRTIDEWRQQLPAPLPPSGSEDCQKPGGPVTVENLGTGNTTVIPAQPGSNPSPDCVPKPPPGPVTKGDDSWKDVALGVGVIGAVTLAALCFANPKQICRKKKKPDVYPPPVTSEGGNKLPPKAAPGAIRPNPVTILPTTSGGVK
jgi:hypothetical protein